MHVHCLGLQESPRFEKKGVFMVMVIGHKIWIKDGIKLRTNMNLKTGIQSFFMSGKYLFRVCFESSFTRMIPNLKYKWPPGRKRLQSLSPRHISIDTVINITCTCIFFSFWIYFLYFGINQNNFIDSDPILNIAGIKGFVDLTVLPMLHALAFCKKTNKNILTISVLSPN